MNEKCKRKSWSLLVILKHGHGLAVNIKQDYEYGSLSNNASLKYAMIVKSGKMNP